MMLFFSFALILIQVVGGSIEEKWGYLAIISMQRSASTNLLFNVVKPTDPCLVSANEVFQNSTQQSGIAWSTAGKGLHGDVHDLEPQVIQAFLERVRRILCNRRIESDVSVCGGRCVLGFKQFSEHLTRKQHAAVWQLPNMTFIVLERPPEERFRSKFVALTTSDWNIDGSPAHKEHIAHMEVPPMPNEESAMYCDVKGALRSLCHTAQKHHQWYAFARATIPLDRRLDVQYSEVVAGSGRAVASKIHSAMYSNNT
mmetsp:Transcript_84492/g.169103  ORF Transcript_84492/g.169103 Transcript_84492/m.169103 type:complete len:256 (+) Transcript_84492:198-965(+)|eukprot:CAMPEP_0171626168 /NCGR_PEP_ID=MMETSP0990-20121206/19855_1 /TAXON_ID=483369 /ORGANISM="non described non described, Strain CCMP2098" /LENGTH=255 /DNA_ID=CAMNT_0012193459 /DNA_START=127 /DNA_END=894 /DNA_ORIENTATION=-